MSQNHLMTRNNELDEWDVPQNSASESEGTTSIDLLQVALRRKGLLALGVFLGLCLAVLYFSQADRVFETRAQVLIEERAAPLQSNKSIEQAVEVTNKAEDHAAVMQSLNHIKKVVEQEAVAKLQSVDENPEFIVGDIIDGLTIVPYHERSSILAMSLQGPNADDVPTILDAIITTYTDSLNEERKNVGNDIIEFFKNEHEENKKILKDVETRRAKFMQDETRLLWNNDKANNPFETRLALIEKKLSDAMQQNSETKFSIKQLEDAMREEVDVDTLYIMAAKDPGFVQLAAFENQEIELAIEKRRNELQKEAQLNNDLHPLLVKNQEFAHKYGPDHPLRRSITDQINMVKELHRTSPVDPAVQQVSDGEPLESIPTRDEVLNSHIRSYLDHLKHELATGKKRVDDLNEEIGVANQAAKVVAKDVFHYDQLTGERERAKKEYESSLAQMNNFNASEKFAGDERYKIVRMADPAHGKQVAPNLAKTLLAGTVLGMLSGFGLAYLLEASDKTFKSPKEVGEALKLQIVGHIPEIEAMAAPEHSQLSPVLIAAHRPKSPLSENFRAIRTALYFSGGGKQHRVIQTTSPVPGDGKSTLTANLAVTIAQSGKRVLLLDADFRRPTQHKLFGLHMNVGLASVVGGHVEPPQAIQVTEIPNLSVMACGPRPDNPSELLTSPEFDDLLKLLRDQYDFVLVDTPPLLAVTDPGVVAAKVDGVLLALRIRKNGRPDALRARKILDDVHANVVGLVVNGLDGKSGSYGYYSNYRKGYGYGYSYSNQYGYGQETEQAIDKYFDEEKQLVES